MTSIARAMLENKFNWNKEYEEENSNLKKSRTTKNKINKFKKKIE